MALLRVIHLADTVHMAGIERHLLLLAQSLREEEVEVIIGCHKGGLLEQEAKRLGVATLPVFGRGGRFAALLRLWPCIRRERIDRIHAHTGFTLLLAAVLHRLTGVPCLFTQHFVALRHAEYRGLKGWLANQLHRWGNAQMAQIVAVSEAAKTAMIMREGAFPSSIRVVPHGIEALTAPDGEREQKVRAAFHIEAEALLVTTVARLEHEKGVHVLLDAIAIVQATLPTARFLLVGDGSQRDTLQAQARTLEIADVVHFAGQREDAAQLIGASDLFVLPSLQEAFGLVLVEAMAQGVPVVATRAGGQVEIVEPDENGLLVPPDDAHALAAAILTLLLAPAKRLAMGAAGYERFQDCFTAERMAQSTRQIYDVVYDRQVRAVPEKALV